MVAQKTGERLRAAEVAALLGVSERTLSRWVKLGRFPKPHSFGKVRYWGAPFVHDWMRSAVNGCQQ